MKTALVIGANGQDGTFLVRHLLKREYKVAGIDKQESSRWEIDSKWFNYYPIDLRQAGTLSDSLKSALPDLIFHMAAVHTSAGGTYEHLFNDVLQVNVASVHEALEYLTKYKNSRLIYASSAKVFGTPLPELINEDTPKKNQDLYAISKNTARNLIEYYRSRHGVKASVVHFFNHESELRPDDFFIPTILRCLASALKDPNHITQINTLEFYCDWGSAEEYMSIMIDMVEKAPGEDFILARGVSTFARDLVRDLFNKYGLNYKIHLRENIQSNISSQLPYVVDSVKLKKYTNRIPGIDIYDVCLKILAIKYEI